MLPIRSKAGLTNFHPSSQASRTWRGRRDDWGTHRIRFSPRRRQRVEHLRSSLCRGIISWASRKKNYEKIKYHQTRQDNVLSNISRWSELWDIVNIEHMQHQHIIEYQTMNTWSNVGELWQHRLTFGRHLKKIDQIWQTWPYLQLKFDNILAKRFQILQKSSAEVRKYYQIL